MLLTAEQLAGLDAATLRLARNEIFARRGGRFGDAALTAHFEQYSWYRPTTFEPVLGEIELKNVELIREVRTGAPARRTDGFIFADSDRRLLTPEEVEALDEGTTGVRPQRDLCAARPQIRPGRVPRLFQPVFLVQATIRRG